VERTPTASTAAATWPISGADGSLPRLSALINVDMIGDQDLLIVDESNSTPALRRNLRAACRPSGPLRSLGREPAAIEDDHMPFLRRGVPANRSHRLRLWPQQRLVAYRRRYHRQALGRQPGRYRFARCGDDSHAGAALVSSLADSFDNRRPFAVAQERAAETCRRTWRRHSCLPRRHSCRRPGARRCQSLTEALRYCPELEMR